jgi:single-strand DNA-binding protein
MNTVTTFAGNLTTDPELRFTPAGTPVAELRVAVNRRVKTGDTWTDAPPTFHTVKVWGTAAENVAESLTRGDRVVVHGTVETDTWETDGQQRSRDTIVVSDRYGEIGTSLRYATAPPTKTRQAQASRSSHDPTGNQAHA